jgi:hypothetical protein
MPDVDPRDDALALEFAEIGRTLGTGPTVDATLELIVAAAVRSIDGCRYAGIFILEDGEIHTVASSDPIVDQVDKLQVQTGEGPCLDAVKSDLPYSVSIDLSDDASYPEFGPQAVNLGVRSGLAVRLLTDRSLGAMNLYSDLPHAFGIVDRARAVILATHCSIALDTAQARADESPISPDDFRAALASRGVIGQAQGILMERERITAEQAFEVLRRASQDLNVKLRDIGQRLVDTGEDPRSPRPPRDPT